MLLSDLGKSWLRRDWFPKQSLAQARQMLLSELLKADWELLSSEDSLNQMLRGLCAI